MTTAQFWHKGRRVHEPLFLISSAVPCAAPAAVGNCVALKTIVSHPPPYLDSIEEQRASTTHLFWLDPQAMSHDELRFSCRPRSSLLWCSPRPPNAIAIALPCSTLRICGQTFRGYCASPTVITVLSPEIAASHDFELCRLSILFSSWRYNWFFLLGLYGRHLLMPQLTGLAMWASFDFVWSRPCSNLASAPRLPPI